MMKLLRSILVGLALAVSFCGPAKAQCGTSAPPNKFCGNDSGSSALATWKSIPPGALSPIGGGTILGNRTTASAAPTALTNPVLGIPGTSTGQIGLAGSGSGTSTLVAQSAAGGSVLQLPTGSGTLASSATSPLVLDSVLGTLSCPTCLPMVTAYGASGSASTTTGSITSGSTSLSLSSALDFANGQGVVVLNAGPATSIGASCLTALASINGSGSTSYTYRVEGRDNNGGVTAAGCTATLATGVATLGTYQAGTAGITMNQVSWTTGTNAMCTLVWRSKNGGAFQLLGCFTGTSIYDTGLPAQTILGAPATPPSSPLANWLATTIVSGAHTTTLTLAAPASTTVSGAIVQHDDTAAITAAFAANTAVSFPAGTYTVRGLQIPSTVRAVVGAGGGQSQIIAIAQTTDGLASGVSASMANGTFRMTGMVITAQPGMSFNGFTLNQGVGSYIGENTFSGAKALVNLSSYQTVMANNHVSSWWNIGIYDVSTYSLITGNTIGNIAGQVGAVAITATPVGSNYQYSSAIWTDYNAVGALVIGNTIDQQGGSFGIGAQSIGASTIGNDIKYTGRECIASGVHSNTKTSANRCFWNVNGNGATSGYDFGISVTDDGVNPVVNTSVSDNHLINPGFSGVGIYGNGGANSYTNTSVFGNVISGANQVAGGPPCGIEISGSNVSGVIVASNTLQSVTANTTYNVCEHNEGQGTPDNNVFRLPMGPAGSSGMVGLIGANSRYQVFPSVSGTVATEEGVETLSNKTLATPVFTYGTGASSTINAISTNTGFSNNLISQNNGTASNSGTIATTAATLTAIANGYLQMVVQGGATPSAQLASGAGLTGGLTISAGAGTLTLTNPALGTPVSGVATNLTGTAAGLTAGNATLAASATKLATARAIGIGGSTGLTATGVNFDGTAAITPTLTGTLAVANGGTGNTGGAFSTYSPTVSCGQSTGTAVCTGQGRYQQIGKLINLTVTITISGTFTGGVINNVALPVQATGGSGGTFIFTGRETAVSGAPWWGSMAANATTMGITNVSNTNSITTGWSITLTGWYEAQ
jgi:hypothetical protein